MKTCAVFHWKRRLPKASEVGANPKEKVSEDFGEQFAHQSCKLVAKALWQNLRKAGHLTDEDKLDSSEGSWYFFLPTEGKRYTVFVEWTPISSTESFFLVRVRQNRGCLAMLLPFLFPAPEVEPALILLKAALVEMPLVVDLRWLSEDELMRAEKEGSLPPREDT